MPFSFHPIRFLSLNPIPQHEGLHCHLGF